jgi:hypothetical protein
MRIMKVPAILTACLTAAAMSVVTVTVAGFARYAAHTTRESIKIVNTMPGPRHGLVTAKGAFKAKGYFFRKRASLIFPTGRLAVRRHLLSTTYTPPNLATCWFKIRQRGTFRVFYATGTYRGLRYSGNFWTDISGRLKRSGPDQCGSKIVFYRTVTYEIGNVP